VRRIRRPVKDIEMKNVLRFSTLLTFLLSMSASLVAGAQEDLAHPRYYIVIREETADGEGIQLDSAAIYGTVDSKSIIRILFDREKLTEALGIFPLEETEAVIRIEAYVQPQNAEKYPVSVEKYSTVVKRTEIAQEASLPESQETKVTMFTRTEYEIHHHDRKLGLSPSQPDDLIRVTVDTHIDLASLNLQRGDRVYLTVSELENQYHLTKILEVKSFGLEVYLKSPIILTYRESAGGETSLAPSPGTTIVFKKVGRVQSWFEDWLHLGVNVAFLDFDSAQSLEVGMALALTIYKDFFEIGYGRNLTMREDPWYWYIGLNVVHLPGQGG